jgi:hypothetical protein
MDGLEVKYSLNREVVRRVDITYRFLKGLA